MGLEQPGLVRGIPTCGRGLGLDGLLGPFKPEPFCDSLILCREQQKSAFRKELFCGLFFFSFLWMEEEIL